MVGGLSSLGELYSYVLSASQALFGTFPPYSAHVPSFHISYYSLTIILVSVPSSSFTLAVSMREVYCVGYTPRAWDPQSILDIPLVFRSFATFSRRLKAALSLVCYNNNNSCYNIALSAFC